jgi:hypothetical protein
MEEGGYSASVCMQCMFGANANCRAAAICMRPRPEECRRGSGTQRVNSRVNIGLIKSERRSQHTPLSQRRRSAQHKRTRLNRVGARSAHCISGEASAHDSHSQPDKQHPDSREIIIYRREEPNPRRKCSALVA